MADGIEKLIKQNSLLAPEAQAVRESFAVISQPECRGRDSSFCATIQKYHEAWKRLANTSPALGLKLLSEPRFRWPKAAYYHHTTRALPEGAAPQISEGLWNKAMAYRWILRNMESSKRIVFLEKTFSTDEENGLVFVWIAKTNMLGMTLNEEIFLRTAEATFKALDKDGSKQKLTDAILDHLYYGVELREALSRPIE